MRNFSSTEKWIIASAIAAVVLLWAVWAICGATIASWFLNSADPEESGNWGDSFGAFNALVSALAFCGVLLTLLLQKKAIQQQQDVVDEQRLDQHRQNFDKSFFQLLEMMRDIRSEISFRYSAKYIAAVKPRSVSSARGAETLSRAGREVLYWIKEKEKIAPLKATEFAEIYTSMVHTRNETKLGPYYRILYTILRRISEDKTLSDVEKRSYGNILRGQLQSREVFLLALNGLTAMSDNFSDYLVEFRIMKYLPDK